MPPTGHLTWQGIVTQDVPSTGHIQHRAVQRGEWRIPVVVWRTLSGNEFVTNPAVANAFEVTERPVGSLAEHREFCSVAQRLIEGRRARWLAVALLGTLIVSVLTLIFAGFMVGAVVVVALMVSGLARTQQRNVKERSNVVMVTWP